jgi:S1-C subfamily serine protease
MAAVDTNIHVLNQASDALADAVEYVARGVVAIHASRHGSASGVLWRSGVVVTVAHAIRRDEDIQVTLPDGSRRQAALAGADGSTDLAVLKVEGEWPHAADIGNSASVRAGQFVFAVARDARGQSSASFGIVGASGGEWRTWRGGHIDRLLRLDGSLPPGFAGGPIADTQGQVIGIGTTAWRAASRSRSRHRR